MEKPMVEQDLLNFRPERVSGAMCRQEQFGAMLVAGNLPILNLNEDAFKIWTLCDGRLTIGEIEATLQEEFETEELHERLLEFFRYCIDNKLLIASTS
jgi:Coenzyme PQQ synthesis protein D (PqqD)